MDCLRELTKELQISAFTVPLYDADARALFFQRAGQLIAALPLEERADYAVSLAMGFALRGVPSQIVLQHLKEAQP